MIIPFLAHIQGDFSSHDVLLRSEEEEEGSAENVASVVPKMTNVKEEKKKKKKKARVKFGAARACALDAKNVAPPWPPKAEEKFAEGPKEGKIHRKTIPQTLPAAKPSQVTGSFSTLGFVQLRYLKPWKALDTWDHRNYLQSTI